MPSVTCDNPLRWPKGQPRTTAHATSRFGIKTSSGTRNRTLKECLDGLLTQLDMMGAVSVKLTADLDVGRSGMFLANYSRKDDPGVTVQWTMPNGESFLLANDVFDNPSDNIWGLALSIEAIRGLERWCGNNLVTLAFSGAKSLPPSVAGSGLFDGLKTKAAIDSRYYELAKKYHPDHGGSDELMAELNSQRQTALKAVQH